MSYVDTSVLAAYYCPEPRSAAVERALRKVKQPSISPLTEVELLSAVSRKLRDGEFDRTTANRIASLFNLHVADGYYRIVPIQAREFALAQSWMGGFSTPLRTLDALHLAAAFS